MMTPVPFFSSSVPVAVIGLLKVHVPSYVVLISNDNIYELIVALSYSCRACPLTMLEHHVLVSRLKEEDKVMTKVIYKV